MVSQVESDLFNSLYRTIDNKENFILKGGAGCGKTYMLMKTLDYIFSKNPKASVACITYTNVAVNEIKNRSPYSNLWVSTIHEFLWNNISSFQKNLKESLVYLVNLYKTGDTTESIKYDGEANFDLMLLQNKRIQYKDYKKLEEGIISHNDVLKLASFMYEKYPLLGRILRDKYPYILIDEYQDAEARVVKIFLNFKSENKQNVIGFFGDPMQSIYPSGIGDIKNVDYEEKCKEMIRPDNRRCSKNVINLLNKIRQDEIQQEPTGNNKEIEGSAKFVYSLEECPISELKARKDIFENWDFNDSENTKELYLTHKLISKEKGFPKLYDVYNNNKKKDDLVGQDKDDLVKHLFKIEKMISLYEAKKYGEFKQMTEFKLSKLEDKQLLYNNIKKLYQDTSKTILEVIEEANSLNLIKKDDVLGGFIKEHIDFYKKVVELPYLEVRNFYDYDNKTSPYSTQHGVKGAEFKNVLVVLDNGKWNQYSFKKMLEGNGNEWTKKIFYVCCSRAKENLVVFCPEASDLVIKKANTLFGTDNVTNIKS